MRGYLSLNETAMRKMRPGDLLMTYSCSAHITPDEFRRVIIEAAARAGRSPRIMENFTHGPDHPIIPAFYEGEYLKGFLLGF